MSIIPGRAAEHLSELSLERLRLGESTTRGTEALRAHLDQCPQCQQRYTALEAEAHARMTDAHVAARVNALLDSLENARHPGARARAAMRRWLARWQLWTPLVVGAAIALVVLWPRDHGTITRAPDLKNAPELQILVLGPDLEPRLLATDEPLASGSRLAFRAACVRHCAMLLAALSETGSAVMVEHAEPGPWQLAPAQWNRLPVQVTVTASLRLVALFCEQAPERESFLARLGQQAALGSEPSRDLAAPLSLPTATLAQCVLRSVLLQSR